MSKTKAIPEIPFRTFIRHSLNIVENPLPFHHHNFKKLGDTFKLKLGIKEGVYFSRDASLATYVLQKNQKNYTKSKIQTEDVAKYLGKGLLTSEAAHWRKQRKLIQPAFHKKQLQQLINTIKTAILSEYNRIEVDEKLDVFPIFNDLAFQTVAKSLFSSAINQKEINRLQHITEATQNMLVKELRQPYLNWWFSVSGTIKKYTNLTDEAKQTLKQAVDQRKASSQKQNDLLDMLLDTRYDDGTSMEEQQLLDEILILFVAGHETTSNALTFTSQLLAQHPEWQERIYQEYLEINSQSNDLMTQIMASKICRQVIEESMRLYPPAYFIDRVNLEDDTFNGMHFKTGSSILFSVIEMHRHPDLWEAPEAFKPERFKDGDRHYSSHYFPFGAGPRKCIGNNFAMFEMIIAIRELIAKYQIEAEFESIDITPLMTLKPKNAFLRFKVR